jgi:leucyl/phenylalanyl-tRNA--protein transferase
MPFFLPPEFPHFPHPFHADEDGVLALCNDLSPKRLLLAYTFGIFPWYNEGEEIFWFYTHPRCVIKPRDVNISKSMRPYFNQKKFSITLDTCFDKVITHCQQTKRKGQGGTWITEKLKASFLELHRRRYAHSVEVWEGDELVGGLYGMSIGKVFFGESMFALKSNASKFGFISLCKILERKGFTLIDCQQRTTHMLRMGADSISKEAFFYHLKANTIQESHTDLWTKWAEED